MVASIFHTPMYRVMFQQCPSQFDRIRSCLASELQDHFHNSPRDCSRSVSFAVHYVTNGLAIIAITPTESSVRPNYRIGCSFEDVDQRATAKKKTHRKSVVIGWRKKATCEGNERTSYQTSGYCTLARIMLGGQS